MKVASEVTRVALQKDHDSLTAVWLRRIGEAPDKTVSLLRRGSSTNVNDGTILSSPRQTVQPLALLVSPKMPAETAKAFTVDAMSTPGHIQGNAAGNSSIGQLVPALFRTASSLFVMNMPYQGRAPAFTDLTAGRVQFIGESIPQAATITGRVKFAPWP